MSIMIDIFTNVGMFTDQIWLMNYYKVNTECCIGFMVAYDGSDSRVTTGYDRL
jgi:hypothetical protein